MEPWIQRLKAKLERLKALDPDCKVFGASRHKHQLNPPKTETELASFEKLHGVKLPKDYRTFLKHIGNGGAGPSYGLESLEMAVYADMDSHSPSELIDVAKPFPHTEIWDFSYSEEEPLVNDDHFYEPDWICGTLRLANYGCVMYLNLVVNGPEAGNIWWDYRFQQQCLMPVSLPKADGRVGFLAWYENWLDYELATRSAES